MGTVFSRGRQRRCPSSVAYPPIDQADILITDDFQGFCTVHTATIHGYPRPLAGGPAPNRHDHMSHSASHMYALDSTGRNRPNSPTPTQNPPTPTPNPPKSSEHRCCKGQTVAGRVVVVVVVEAGAACCNGQAHSPPLFSFVDSEAVCVVRLRVMRQGDGAPGSLSGRDAAGRRGTWKQIATI